MSENSASDEDSCEIIPEKDITLFTFNVERGISSIKFRPHTIISIPLQKIGKYSSLNYLSLPNNNLRRISEEVFTVFPQLIWFDVRDNKIHEFPRVVGHNSLETILLGGNRIEKLPIELGSFKELSCVQVQGNPLVFPHAEVLEKLDKDLVSFLKLCWAHQTEKPHIKMKSSNKEKKRKAIVKKEDSILAVKNIGNIANVVTEKMKSVDPVDQLLASHVVKKMRAIDKQIQKTKDQEVLKAWREMYSSRGVILSDKPRVPPYDTDAQYMSMLNRNDLLRDHGLNKLQNKVKPIEKKPLNINEELINLDKELDSMRNRKPLLEPTQEKIQRLNDIQKMNEILQKIKRLELMNFRSLN